MELLKNKDKDGTISAAVCTVIDEMKIGDEIDGFTLQSRCAVINPDCAHKYVETLLRTMRLKRRVQMVCIDRAKSKYRKVMA